MALDGKGRKFFLERYEQLGQKVKHIEIKPTIRINTLKTTEYKIHERMKKKGVKLNKIPFLKNGFTVQKSPFSMGATPEFLQGYYTMQEAAAQTAVKVLDPKEGETILDCCASPGGKTTQIAQIMKNTGKVVALELKDKRLKSIKSNLERLGITNTIAYNMDARKVEKLNMKFDKILIDAPCSGNFITDKKWFDRRDIQGVRRSSRIQKQIIEACMKVLKKGGILVYSTCSMEPEENELNVQWMIDNFKVNIEKTGLDVGSEGLTNIFGKEIDTDIRKTKRFWPNLTGTQGFFVAKVKK